MTEKTEIAVVIVAAGRGERAGQSKEGPKQYRTIGGQPVMRRTVAAFAAAPGIGRIVIAIHRDDAALFNEAIGDFEGRVSVVTGGATRQESTLFALRALAGDAPAAVLIHDCVRPFVDAGLIGRVGETALEGLGALPALPVSDTLKRAADDGLIAETVPRDGLHAAQTPQGFPFQPILAAHEAANDAGKLDFTDDAAIAEWHGIPVKIVAGSADNIKLTWARDIEMADARLSQPNHFPDVRTGNGYDVHAFGPGDAVVLCGVRIGHDKALSGHSDADVGLHALTDALLATCGAGDIGTHFPPSEPKWNGEPSKTFLSFAAERVRARSGRIVHLDLTLICEAPKIGPHVSAIRASIAGICGISESRVSVKATTSEKMGFVGRKEGLAALGTATIELPRGAA